MIIIFRRLDYKKIKSFYSFSKIKMFQQNEETLNFIQSLDPKIPFNIIEVIFDKFKDQSANYILDTEYDIIINDMNKHLDIKEKEKKEAENYQNDLRIIKKRIVDTYGDVEIAEDYITNRRPDAMMKKQIEKDKEKKKQGIRYLDGCVVSRKSEKFIVEKKEENPETFVKLRIAHTKRRAGQKKVVKNI